MECARAHVQRYPNLKEGCHLFDTYRFSRFLFYNSNPIAMFPCALFPDIYALKHEFPNCTFLPSKIICICILCFGHIANKFNDILPILKEVITFPEKGHFETPMADL